MTKKFSHTPQSLDPHKTGSTGAEVWSDAFVYPNGWHFSSQKRVLIKDPPQSQLGNIAFLLKNKPIIRSSLLFLCYLLLVITSIFLIWKILFV